MSDVAYHLLVIAMSVLGIVVGYRRGLLRQVSAVLGVAFGIVCARAFAYVPEEWFRGNVSRFFTGFNAIFVVKTLSSGVIFTVVYIGVRVLTFMLGYLMKVFRTGILNSIAGAVFCMFKYLMFLSILYNIIIDVKPEGGLLKFAGSHDGNVVEGVIWLAPAVLGFPDGEDVGHALQLEEAKKIS